MSLVVDIETTGLPMQFVRYQNPDGAAHPECYIGGARCRVVSLSYMICSTDDPSAVVSPVKTIIVAPEGFDIPAAATAIHGITTAEAVARGRPIRAVLDEVLADMRAHDVSVISSYNVSFDVNVLLAEASTLGHALEAAIADADRFCTMIPASKGRYPRRLDAACVEFLGRPCTRGAIHTSAEDVVDAHALYVHFRSVFREEV